MPGKIDLAGQRFGLLVVVEEVGLAKEGAIFWRCRCDCGGEITTRGTQLRRGRARSCGCSRISHGLGGTRIYDIWFQMKRRCEDPSSRDYVHYGARGIRVCERWQDVRIFMADMGVPAEGETLERRDVDGPYSPENCCWVTQKEQTRNARSNIQITFNGRTQCLGAWAEELGIKYRTLYNRIVERGLSPEAAFKPVGVVEG